MPDVEALIDEPLRLKPPPEWGWKNLAAGMSGGAMGVSEDKVMQLLAQALPFRSSKPPLLMFDSQYQGGVSCAFILLPFAFLCFLLAFVLCGSIL